jgi:hypothetical protein
MLLRFLVVGIYFGVDHMMTKGVQYRGLAVPGYPDLRKIVKVNMTVDQVSGFEGPHKPEESPETPMAGVFPVVYSFRGGVSQEYVQITSAKNPVKEQYGYFYNDSPEHFDVGKLIFPVVVLHGTSQSHDDEAFLPVNSGIYINGAGRIPALRKIVVRDVLFPCIIGVFFQVVVAEYKEQWFVQGRNDEFKVIHGEIARAQDQINIPEPFFYRR